MQAWLEYGDGKSDKALRTVREVERIAGFSVYYYLHSGLMLEMAGRDNPLIPASSGTPC